jgi:hypothetical protein
MVAVIPAVVLVMVVDFDHLVRDYRYPVAWYHSVVDFLMVLAYQCLVVVMVEVNLMALVIQKVVDYHLVA